MSLESTVLDTRVRPSALRAAVALVSSSVVAVVLNWVVSAIAVSLGAPASYAPLTLPVFAAFTVAGIVVGWFGWLLVNRKAARPRVVLAWLAPAVLILSFLPDIALLAWRFIPGTNTAAAVALMVMHLVVFAVAIPTYAWLSPAPRSGA